MSNIGPRWFAVEHSAPVLRMSTNGEDPDHLGHSGKTNYIDLREVESLSVTHHNSGNRQSAVLTMRSGARWDVEPKQVKELQRALGIRREES